MLNKLMEKKQIKCHLYWPNEMGADKALKLPHVKLTVELVRLETYQNFVRRWFKWVELFILLLQTICTCGLIAFWLFL